MLPGCPVDCFTGRVFGGRRSLCVLRAAFANPFETEYIFQCKLNYTRAFRVVKAGSHADTVTFRWRRDTPQAARKAAAQARAVWPACS